MKDEAISSSGDLLLPPRSSSPPPSLTPAASSVGTSSSAVPTNAGSTDWFGQAQNSKGGSPSHIGLQPMWTSLCTSAGDFVLRSSQPSCRSGKEAASALGCARRGWVNVDVDRICVEDMGRPPNGGCNYEEVVEFDPIKHHNHFCPWMNGNVAAAGCSSSSGSGSSAGAQALCSWQLTLDALDAFLAQVPIQTMESESAASMDKDDRLTPGRKLLVSNSFS
ncbi:unnamed protein product [Fraxinus pennsylvanica]|uniref:NuBaID C-terminal domain-containing protein n=1 Tax=Fraxinus pennsylvanica TaxID=56036 RepID=A0AAD2AF92_9LAMI|nr:unnamed protein product [Fraxinus pennsylvanica]